jgi:ribosomal-protein-alanine N-acetyltransferase
MVDDDAPFMLTLLNDPSFIRNIGDRGVRTVDDARRYIQNGPRASYARHGFGLWLVELIGDGEPVGICGLLKRDILEDVDVGFAFLPAYQSKGFGYESARAVLDYARDELGLRRVVAIVSAGNEVSARLLEKLGMRFEGMIQPFPAEPPLRLFAVDFLAPSPEHHAGHRRFPSPVDEGDAG